MTLAAEIRALRVRKDDLSADALARVYADMSRSFSRECEAETLRENEAAR
jgi:hypothetical protein